MQEQQLDLNLIDRLHRKEHRLQLQVLIRHQEQLNRQQLKHELMQVYYHHFHLGLEIHNKARFSYTIIYGIISHLIKNDIWTI